MNVEWMSEKREQKYTKEKTKRAKVKNDKEREVVTVLTT